MASDPTRPIESQRLSAKSAPAADRKEEFERLRKLLLGKEQVELRELTERFEAWGLTPEEVAEQLPEAIALRTAQDDLLGRALAPTLEEGISESVDRNPQQIAQAIYPILGPAIRKAISETISGFVETLNRAIEHSMSIQGLKWRIEAWRTGVPYGQIVLKHALVYQVEQAFLIHTESGLLLAHVALDEKKSQDPDLVSGMLTAIRDFVGDSFDAAQEDGLRTFSVGELTVMVETGPRAMLAAVVRGQAPAKLYEEVNEALEDVHLQLRAQLKAFEGDTEPFVAAEPTLEELLETVVETDRPQTRSMAPRIAWVVAGLAALVIAGLWIRSLLRWNEAVRVVRDEPGIVLIDSDRGWRRWSFEGMRDPLARDPAAALEEAGFDPTRVEGVWEPYMSFDREMVMERAGRVLDPPATTELFLEDDVLIVEGAASARWVIPARQRARNLTGVSELDLSRLTVTVPPDLSQTSGGLQSHRVLFPIGSSELTPESVEVLDALAADLALLLDEAGDVGYRIAVDILGRTDTSGTEELNRALSEQRAGAVLEALDQRGIRPDEVRTVGLGVTDPLPGTDEEETARLNRSVSFVITLTGWDNGNESGE